MYLLVVVDYLTNVDLNYWSKDLIFLFYSEGLVGMQAWTEAYTGIKLSSN
jgi:hypothetical protein